MLSRRNCLIQGSLVAGLAALGVRVANGRNAASGPLGLPIGLQIYSVRQDFAKDLAGTLRKVAAIGYSEVEFAGLPPMPAAQLRALLLDCGLSAPSIHVSMADLQSGMQQRLDYAKAIGSQYIVCSFPSTADDRFRDAPAGTLAAGITLDDWRWNAEQLNRIGETARGVGLSCGYHNHNIEFRAYDGVVAYDELLRLTTPTLVTMELDIGWVVSAGVDPLRYLQDHAARISLLHIKDVRKNAQIGRDRVEGQTTELGTGQIDWQRVFAATSPPSVRHIFVEQENFAAHTPLQAARINFNYLRELGRESRGPAT